VVISGASVTEEKTSPLVIDGNSLMGSDMDVAPSVGSALVKEGLETGDESSKLIVVDGSPVVSSRTLGVAVSESLAELSTTVGVIDGVS